MNDNDDAIWRKLQAAAAKALEIDAVRVTLSLSYQAISEWDSFAHINLILAVEKDFVLRIPSEALPDLTSMQALLNLVLGVKASKGGSVADEPFHDVTIHRGLNGVYFDTSAITMIDGLRGRLCYRGYDVDDVADCLSFEDTFYLLVHGSLPDVAARSWLMAELQDARSLSYEVEKAISAMRAAPALAALRTGVSMIAAFDIDAQDFSPEAALRKGIRLASQIPLMLAVHQAARKGQALPAYSQDNSHARYVLKLLAPDALSNPVVVRLFEQDLIVHADHSANASTFVARIATSTQADFHAALTAALGTFGGRLHGGAVQDVMEMLDDIGVPARAASYVKERLSRNQPIPGFGHRVYRTADPRARLLRQAAFTLAHTDQHKNYLAILEAVIDTMREHNRFGVDVNVDFYAAVTYQCLGLSAEQFAPLFVVGRIAGWTAHIIEQMRNNILIRPLLHYDGPKSSSGAVLRERL